jgi:hypothetical protein
MSPTPPPADDARTQLERLARAQGATTPHHARVRRSPLWIFWAAMTVLFVWAGIAEPPWPLVAAPFTGLYARYLYHGGKVRFFIV